MFPLPGIQNAARARWSTLCVRQSLLEVAREGIFLYRKTFDRFLAGGGGEDTPTYSRDDCAVLTNFDERFGALRSVLSVNRKNLFAYCCLDLRYFALLLCALSLQSVAMCIPNRARHMYIHTMHVCVSARVVYCTSWCMYHASNAEDAAVRGRTAYMHACIVCTVQYSTGDPGVGARSQW